MISSMAASCACVRSILRSILQQLYTSAFCEVIWQMLVQNFKRSRYVVSYMCCSNRLLPS